ncbi:MAG TPA: acetate--CoA ligase family protein [Bacteroidales bacterium]|jgi:acetyltransferase|nr:acetate--CoA ligase family protein [Bacteroidales bacterium]MDI9532874.1 acetate--CoA ligase family protein [Bacteroidota bacterium]MBP7035653.1 acetate--CoA ligase family protein [Bacteroidales bacterium]MBP8709782.1 acetate--CoA ligase family protein [Bacteroidales bacterium]HOR09033.1 acetate--CoA ligase family protein [Bacteroidales bacterium]
MINAKLLNPKSIVVVGGSDDITKAGGRALKNLLNCDFNGDVHVVNPKSPVVQGIKTFPDVSLLPHTDLAIIAVAARFCPAIVRTLATEKGTGGFIILSAGFSEENEVGAALEKEIVDVINSTGGTLIGPNCIGYLNNNYHGVFTEPIPRLSPNGIDFISGSGATAVFILETAITGGLPFSSVWSVGNSAQIGVEDVLEHLDITFDPLTSSRIKLLYIENITDPQRFLRHSSSLIRKGCRIAAIKAGSSEAGSRAASSHTGAMASPDTAVDALLRKAGIVRCYSRTDLAIVAALFTYKPLKGKRIAIVTHAGGPAVMLTDILSEGGMEIPHLTGPAADRLLEKLFAGSSVANPIDFLATGTAEQLGYIIDACENDFDEVDAIAVIFGSPGLFPVDDVYNLLHEKIRSCKKPVYPIMPSVINVKREIAEFIARGNAIFTDEVFFGRALCMVNATSPPAVPESKGPHNELKVIREVIESASDGYLPPEKVNMLLKAAGIETVPESVVTTAAAAVRAAGAMGYPVVMKVVGPVHKSDIGGVVLNIDSEERVRDEFARMMTLPEVTGILVQKMISGREIFCGATREDRYGHLVMAGMGGIFIEVFKDVSTALVPVSDQEARSMIRSLRSYKIIRGIRGTAGVNEEAFVRVITSLSDLLAVAPEIAEMDINPLLGTPDNVVAVDARIRVQAK